MNTVPELKTDRLVLKGMDEYDADFIVKVRSDPAVYKYFNYPHRLEKSEHLNWYYGSYLKNENRIEWIAWNNNCRIGVFGIRRDSSSPDECEVSYILDPAQYGKGYAFEAVTAMIGFCRETWNTRDVKAVIHFENISSVKLVKKLGFIETGRSGDFMCFEKSLDRLHYDD